MMGAGNQSFTSFYTKSYMTPFGQKINVIFFSLRLVDNCDLDFLWTYMMGYCSSIHLDLTVVLISPFYIIYNQTKGVAA